MATNKSLEIFAPRQGIASSPHVGFGNSRNIDIHSIPGIAKLNNILEKKSSTTVDAQPLWAVKNPASPANIYVLDSNGVVYNSSDSGATWAELSDRGGNGQGLAIWKDYLFVMEVTTIDVYGPLSGAPSWSDNWKTIDTDSAWHPTFISKNDSKLYGGAGKYVFSVEENSGQNFAPGTAASYTFTQQALDLPEDYKIKCLEEQGNYLLCGTWQGTNIYDVEIADIYPWDRSSPSFEQPIQIKAHGVHAMLTDGGYTYVLAGVEGMIYKSNGSLAWPIAQVPQSVCNIAGGKYLEFYPGAFIKFKNRYFFGVSSQSTAGMGIWSFLEGNEETILNHEHSISTLTDGGTNPLIIGCLLGITRDKLLAGWRDNATYGLDVTNTASYAYGTDYSGYFETALYIVGSRKFPMTFSELELLLAKELAASEGVKIQCRINLTDSFAAAGSQTDGIYLTTLESGQASYEDRSGIPSCQTVQMKVALKGTATTTPEFRLLALVP